MRDNITKNAVIYEAAIIGGGVSGLASACFLAEKINGAGVIILERTDRVGKKLAATGNGQGNLTNEKISRSNYHGADASFTDFALSRFGNRELREFLDKTGLPTVSVNGRVYPMSRQATCVVDLIRARLSRYNVETRVNFEVVSIRKNGVFALSSADGDTVYAKRAILCAGGKSARQFGTDGAAYALAESLGHTVTKLYPSLVQIKTDVSEIKALRGIKCDCTATALDGGKPLKSERGEVLFTEYGLSGSAVFAVSGTLSGCQKPSVRLEFLPDLSLSEAVSLIKNKWQNAPYLEKEDVLNGIINKQVGRVIFRKSDGSAESIAGILKNFTLNVTGTLGFNYSQVTKGGINTSEIDSKTMRSKLTDGLYFAGEITDVDGDCGGYNVQWAFSSARLAADAVIKECGIE